MNLAIPDPYGLSASDALSLASERGLWPTAMGTAEIREVAASLRDRAVFSARTTNAVYLQALKDRIERYLAAGYKGDLASLRVELKDELRRLGYSPLTGFPGDEELGIEPAEPGSLQDLGSRYAAASHDVEFAFEVKQCCSSIRRLATFICFSH